MSRKLVVKRLSASDLTLFKSHFDKTPGAKQKAINLDIDPFVSILYPSLPEVAAATPRGAIPLDLSIYGPGLAGQHNLARKILKQQKNWRLNGEYVNDPEDMPGRYDDLQKGDYAIFDFYGDIVPQSIRIYFVACANSHDRALHAAINAWAGARLSPHRSMLIMDVADIEGVLDGIETDPAHPILDLLEESDLEDAALGGPVGAQRLVRRRAGRPVRHEEFQRAKKNAERNGRLGEELINAWLESRRARGEVMSYKWEADENAVSPYDFCVEIGAQQRLLDVKSTSGPFNNRVHVSTAELLKMKEADMPYDLYRLYEVMESSCKCRIAADVKNTAASILKVFDALPAGVSVDGIATSPEIWNFSATEIDISVPPEEEDSQVE